MARLAKIIKGHRYQVGRFAGKWYVADLDRNRFIYGPFARRQTAEARITRLPKRLNPRKRKCSPAMSQLALLRLPSKPAPKVSGRNPSRGVVIYGRVLKIFARKTSGPFKGQSFVHTFKPGAVMVGMPDGSIRISHP